MKILSLFHAQSHKLFLIIVEIFDVLCVAALVSLFLFPEIKVTKEGKKKLGFMENSLGLLRITVIKGLNLAIRDSRSSDPYLIIRMGKQVRLIVHACFEMFPMDGIQFSFTCAIVNRGQLY